MTRDYKKHTEEDRAKCISLAYEGKSLREIAEATGWAQGYVGSVIAKEGISLVEIRKNLRASRIKKSAEEYAKKKAEQESEDLAVEPDTVASYYDGSGYKQWPGNSKHPIFVNKQGDTWSTVRGPMGQSKSGAGYLRTTYIDNDDNATAEYVHRMVWQTFVGEIPEGYEINHKDLDKTNNTLSNLELLSHKDNIRHARKCKSWYAGGKLTKVTNVKTNEEWLFATAQSAAEFLRVSITSVSHAVTHPTRLMKRGTYRVRYVCNTSGASDYVENIPDDGLLKYTKGV